MKPNFLNTLTAFRILIPGKLADKITGTFRTILFVGIITTLLTGSTSFGQRSVHTENALKSTISKVMPAFFDSANIGAVMLIAKKGKIIYKKATGKANIELNVPMTTDRVFRIASITKQFTAVAILQLIEKGLLNLDDDVKKIIPDYPTHDYTITIANLLSHTSGIKSITEMNDLAPDVRRKDNTPLELINLFKDQPMDFAPGTKYHYSNSGYILLGYIIEKLSGKTYERYITDNIFKPLGMTNAGIDNPVKIIKNRANGYVEIARDTAINADYLNASYAYSAGSLTMTVEDLYKWHKALYDYKVIKKETLAEAFTPFTLVSGEKTKYGFGWELDTLDGSATIQHSGSINGFSSFEIYLPAEDVFVVTFSNGINKNTAAPSKLAACLIAGKTITKEINLPDSVSKKYTGVYKFKVDQPATIVIFKKNGKLYMKDSHASQPWLMHFTKPTEFYCYNVFPNNHIFSTDTTGRVNGFTILAQNYTSKITKIE